MTTINIAALETQLGLAGPIDGGQITAIYWAGRGPYVKVNGGDVTFPAPIRVRIVDGEPASPIVLEATGDVCCVRWEIISDASNDVHLAPYYTSIPDTGPVDFGDLPVVNPETFAPVSTPSLLDAIATIVHDLTYDRF